MTEKLNDPRVGIDVAGLLAALQAHVIDGVKMSPSQVSAAIALLKKALPDLPTPDRPAEKGGHKSHEEALQELE